MIKESQSSEARLFMRRVIVGRRESHGRDSGAPEEVSVQETFRFLRKTGGAGRHFLYFSWLGLPRKVGLGNPPVTSRVVMDCANEKWGR